MFKCKVCGKSHPLSEMHYDPYDNYRVCDKCFNKYREDRFSKIEEENKVVVEEMLKLRAEVKAERELKEANKKKK